MLSRESKDTHQSKKLIIKVYLSKAHENYIIKALINNSVEKNFLSQKLIIKKEILINVTRVSAYIRDSYFFVIYE